MYSREQTFAMLFVFVLASADEFVRFAPGFKVLEYEKNLTATSLLSCGVECTHTTSCIGFSFNNASHQCEILVTKPLLYGSQRFVAADRTWHLYERGSCSLGERSGRHCHYFRYALAGQDSTWLYAKNSCVEMGLGLSIVVDEPEATSFNANLNVAYPYAGGAVWLGASSPEGITMQWLDGTIMNYTYFAQYPGTLAIGSCLFASHETMTEWFWRYLSCSSTHGFVCERRND